MKFHRLLVSALAIFCVILAFGGTQVSAAPQFDQPLLITSVGQSADGQMVRVLAQRAGLNFSYDTLADASAVSNYRTLVLVVGGSSKGLGAAGINADQEENRARNLISAAKNSGVGIIVMHVGGESRRGDLTDRFVHGVAPSANYLIVVADGNGDNIFGQFGIPLDLPGSVAESGSYLKAAMR